VVYFKVLPGHSPVRTLSSSPAHEVTPINDPFEPHHGVSKREIPRQDNQSAAKIRTGHTQNSSHTDYLCANPRVPKHLPKN